jgi:hypothetical protein
MRGILNIRMLSVCAALLAVLAAGLMLPGAQAQSANQNQRSDKQASGSSQAQPPSAGRKAAEEESTPANKEHAGGPQEGIKIHGHWVIDVRNPDGKLVTHREFENVYQGEDVAASFLDRTYSVGLWAVTLDISGSTQLTLVEPPYTGGCIGVCVSNNLLVSRNGLGFQLVGSETQGTAGTIVAVQSGVGRCPPTNPPATPCLIGPDLFTATVISPIAVVSGQTVQVTVTITFS